MRKSRAGLGSIAAASVIVALAAAAPVSAAGRLTSDPVAPGVITTGTPIRHVVIIYQENHTFDDVLGQLCQVRANPCNGYTGPVTFADGNTADNVVEPDIVPSLDHSPAAQRAGAQDRWDDVEGCEQPPYPCVTHIDPAHIPNLATLADTFTVSDATFAAGRAASFGAHVTLGGGTFDGFSGWNPVNSVKGVKPRKGWGCSSRQDDLWGPPHERTYQPSCIPDQQGQGPYRPSEVPYTPTIMERMEQAGMSWHIYEGVDNTRPVIGPWSVCTYFAWCALNRFHTRYDSNRTDFLTEAAAGDLPNLSLVLPTGQTPGGGGVSQHNGNSMAEGDNYIGDLVTAVENGSDWDSTAIFITYDDCGCFYDHVTPPSKRMGLRNPMVIVSPWAKPQGTDSTTAVQPYSMLAFVEHVFGLAPLTKEVTHSYDYADSFDFSQQPIPGPRMTTQQIPRWERPTLRRLAPIEARDPA